VTSTDAVARYLARSRAIPGWLHRSDGLVIEALCRLQTRAACAADIMEIGVYHGRSAILLGYLLQEGERLFACDLFEDQQGSGQRHYASVTQGAFEAEYGKYHATPPVIVKGPSSELSRRGLACASFRLIHVDGSHEPAAVAQDLRTARELLVPGGVVVFEDDHSVHVPGIPPAVRHALGSGALRALCITAGKTYALPGEDVLGLIPALRRWAEESPDVQPEVRALDGRDALVLYPLPRREGPWRGLDRKLSSPPAPSTC
jgi:predicted O-methyltransferase YrrM